MPRTADQLWSRFGGAITIVMTLVGWSSIPLFLKHFSHSIDAWTSNGWRYGFSALLWSPVLILGIMRSSLPPGLWRAAIVPSIINCAAQAVFCWAHYKIDAGLLSFGLRSNIVFVTIGAAIFFAAERRVIRSPGFLLGILMVVGGTVGTILLGDLELRGATLSGVILAIASGAGFAGYSLSVRHFMHGVNAIQSFAAISLYTAMGTTVLMLTLGEESGATALALLSMPAQAGGWSLPVGQFTLLLISAVIGIALGHVFYYYSISRLGVAVSSGVVQLQPFLVAIGSFALFGEELTGLQWASGTIAIAGAAVVLYVQHYLRRVDARRPIAAEPKDFAELPPDHVAAAVASELEDGRRDGALQATTRQARPSRSTRR